ncbi:hypothetical protein D0T84_16210 [Dysgonomonas sp. 521]|uniref:hypothetical protein n=1 Tax=Dysgonomonas sp. 521 TaxID=2302932 RepID=UPI0013D6F4B5|nr:hypothetical protein [Dysgonomonas sp. 521]NDV96445.1 hypothetical protein [Dysgonomonas sp. 521]
MKSMIHLNDVRKLLNSKRPVNLKCWKMEDASVMECKGVVCTSSNFKNSTFNIRFPESGEIRTIRAICIHEVNGKDVFI